MFACAFCNNNLCESSTEKLCKYCSRFVFLCDSCKRPHYRKNIDQNQSTCGHCEQKETDNHWELTLSSMLPCAECRQSYSIGFFLEPNGKSFSNTCALCLKKKETDALRAAMEIRVPSPVTSETSQFAEVPPALPLSKYIRPPTSRISTNITPAPQPEPELIEISDEEEEEELEPAAKRPRMIIRRLSRKSALGPRRKNKSPRPPTPPPENEKESSSEEEFEEEDVLITEPKETTNSNAANIEFDDEGNAIILHSGKIPCVICFGEFETQPGRVPFCDACRPRYAYCPMCENAYKRGRMTKCPKKTCFRLVGEKKERILLIKQ